MIKKIINAIRQKNTDIVDTADNLPASGKRFRMPWSEFFASLALAGVLMGGWFTTRLLFGINKGIAEAKETTRPANVTLTKITTPNCGDCFNLDNAVAALKKQHVLVSEEKTMTLDSPEAQNLIKQFGIQKAPTYILTGEITKSNFAGFTKTNGTVTGDTFVFTNVKPIFVDTETQQERGKVTAIIITDPTCVQCIDPKLTIDAYKKSGVVITAQHEVAWNSPEGQKLIKQYTITKLPTFLLSPEIDVYDNVKRSWKNIGTVEAGGTYVARNLRLPYRDVTKNRILGLVDFVYLTDAKCDECYDVQKTQKPILTRGYGLGLASEHTVDIASPKGQSLVHTYKITKVPTILLSPAATEYANFKNSWTSVGTVEPDGWYVFRNMDQLGGVTYKDVSRNQVIKPTDTSAAN